VNSVSPLPVAAAILLAAPSARAADVERAYLIWNPGAPEERHAIALRTDVTVTVRAGEELLVIHKGATMRVKGPWSGPVARARQESVARTSFLGRLARLVMRVRHEMSAYGGSRGDGNAAAVAPPAAILSLALVPPVLVERRAGRQCYAEGSPPLLWRGWSAPEARYRLEGGGLTAIVTFPAGVATAEWPASMPLVEQSYRMGKVGGVEPPGEIKLTRVAGARRLTALDLLRVGCEHQAEAVLASVVAEAAARPLP
jgi:hypothetical protein